MLAAVGELVNAAAGPANVEAVLEGAVVFVAGADGVTGATVTGALTPVGIKVPVSGSSRVTKERPQIPTVLHVDAATGELVQDQVRGAGWKAPLHAGGREQQKAMSGGRPAARLAAQNGPHRGREEQHRAVGSAQVLKQGAAQESYLHWHRGPGVASGLGPFHKRS